jgi:hypothetical protein
MMKKCSTIFLLRVSFFCEDREREKKTFFSEKIWRKKKERRQKTYVPSVFDAQSFSDSVGRAL